MGGSSSLRKTLAAGSLLAATALGATFALAQEGPPVPVNFNDPQAAMGQNGPALDLDVRDDAASRFSPTDPSENGQNRRRLELELSAGGGNSPVDVSVAQRASLGSNADGDVDRAGRGSELRIGRGLVGEREASSEPSVYMFVASDDEALTWQPGSGNRNEFGSRGSSLQLQDRVEIGDMSAGVTWEQNGVQASLAYVERSESTRVGRRHYSHDQEFAGVTVTMRTQP
jgi:hypothetical protein